MPMTPSPTLIVEPAPSPARLTELGVHGWPVWKDGEGERTISLDAGEKSYFLAGSATLSLDNGEQVTVNAGDLVIVPPGPCRWQVHASVRRHYRSEAPLPPAASSESHRPAQGAWSAEARSADGHLHGQSGSRFQRLHCRTSGFVAASRMVLARAADAPRWLASLTSTSGWLTRNCSRISGMSRATWVPAARK